MEKVAQYLGWIVLVTLILAIARQLSDSTKTGIFSRNYLEGFADSRNDPPTGGAGNPPQAPAFNVPSMHDSSGSMNPASPELSSPFLPFTLRKDLPVQCQAGDLTAESCYKSDFASKIQPTGNFIQSTNNYIHKTPDSCTAPFTELVDSFYLNN